MANKGFFQRISEKLFFEFQHIQNLKVFFWIEIILFIIGMVLIYFEKPNIEWHELSYRIFELIMITVPISAIFQAYKIYRKTEWITIGRKKINVPRYLEHIKKKYKRQEEKYSVETEINNLYEDFQAKEELIMNDLESCSDFPTFKQKILPQILKLKEVKIPILFMKGKEYHVNPTWYLGLLLRIKDRVSFYNKNIEICNHVQNEINEMLSKHHFDDDELEHIKKRKDYSKYFVKMNQLVRIIGMYYNTYLDDVDKHSVYIEQLKKVFNENPELDEFVNNVILKIDKKETGRWEKRIEVLELENYLIMKYKNNSI